MNVKLFFPLLLFLLACGGDEGILYSGSIEIDEVRISARVSGGIEELGVNEGDLVQASQILMKIDETEYQFALQQSEASLVIAEANLETLIQGTRQQEILSASGEVEAARAAMDLAVTDLARARELAAAGALSEQGLQAAETSAIQAQIHFNSSVQGYSLTLEGARSTDIQAATAAVASEEAAVNLALQRLEWTSITSPITGIVTGTNILQGENIAPGTTLLTVADMDTVKAVFYLSQPDLPTTQIGSEVIVSTGTEGEDPVSGVITHIADRAEFTPSQVETRSSRTSLVYRVEAEVPNPGSIFKAGMPVDVRIAESR